MAFGFAGAADGAAKSLDEIVAQRLFVRKLEEEIANRQKQTELDQAALNQRALEHSDQMRLAQAPKPQPRDPIADHRAIKEIDKEYAAPPKPERDPIADYEAKAKIDQKYAKPSVPNEKGPFVVGGNLVDASGKVIFRGQDASAQGPSPYAQERADRTTASVDDILGSINGWTAGYGSMLSGVPQTDARSLKGKLDTLKANIAFNELTAMREASKTGGALGSIAVRELELLESALGSLDQGLAPDQLKANLGQIKQSVERWKQAAGPSQVNAMQPAPSHGAAPTAPKRMRFDRTGKPIP